MVGLALVSFVAVFAAGIKGSIDDAIDKTLIGDLTSPTTTASPTSRSASATRSRRSTGSRSPRRSGSPRTRSTARQGTLTLVDPETAARCSSSTGTRARTSCSPSLGADEAVIDEEFAADNGLEVGDTFTADDGQRRDGDATRSSARSPTTATSSATTAPPTPTPRRYGERATPRPTSSSTSSPAPTPPRSAPSSRRRSTQPSRRSRSRTRRSSRTRSPSSSTSCSGSSTCCCALGGRLAVRDRQHAGADDPRAHPRARPAARGRHVAPPGPADGPLRGGDHGADRRRPRARRSASSSRCSPAARSPTRASPSRSRSGAGRLLVLAAIAGVLAAIGPPAEPRGSTCSRRWRTSRVRRMNVAKVLPLCFVMIAGPQILSAIFLATTENWRRNSLAYVAGASLSITGHRHRSRTSSSTGPSAGSGERRRSTGSSSLCSSLAAIHVYLAARDVSSRRSGWASSQTATPRLLLPARLPAARLVPDRHPDLPRGRRLPQQPWRSLVALPALYGRSPCSCSRSPALAAGRVRVAPRTRSSMPKVRDWMNDNSWVVSEIVIVFFVLLVGSDLA